MNLLDPTKVRRVAIIGTGVIGGGWVAHFLRRGLEVSVYDPGPRAKTRLREMIDDVWPTLERLGLEKGASPDRLTFASEISDAVNHVDFVQENTPEREEFKIDIIRKIDAATAPSVVIASSTSGVPMTKMQQGCRHPYRCVVGHPFNPPYLIPLVEVVGGEQTSPDVVDWTMNFYEAMGKRPLKLERELPGFLANRLIEAVWREALHLVSEGLATVEEIDIAMTHGPALRWAIIGPCMTFHLAGGEGGMDYFLDHFGPALKLPWTYMDAPELTPELRQCMIEGCKQVAAGKSVKELMRERDDRLIAILKALENPSAQ